MSKTIERFEKQVQKKLAQTVRFQKNLEVLKSVPRALESYIAMFTPRGGKPDYERVFERIFHMKYDFEANSEAVWYRSEFAECVFTFDTTKRPMGWRTPGEANISGVIRT